MTFRILHIHTNEKFLYASKIFYSDLITNEEFLVKKGSKQLTDNKFKLIEPNDLELQNLAAYASGFDAVVIYDFCELKRKIVRLLSPQPIVIWRLFGYELYDLKRQSYLTSKSIEAKKPVLDIFPKGFFSSLSEVISKKVKILFGQKNESVVDFFPRTNYIIAFCPEEVDHLRLNWPALPAFIQLPFYIYDNNQFTFNTKREYIILGNSRSSYNNHFDIFEIIEQNKLSESIPFKVVFSYGPENYYTTKLRKKGKTINGLSFIENFMTPESYHKFYDSAIALVLNCHRQMAMGNIFFAFRHGVRVYLNPLNPIYNWLLREGFMVSDINELVNDLKKGKIIMSHNDATHNFAMLNTLPEKYSVGEFQSKVLLEISRRKSLSGKI